VGNVILHAFNWPFADIEQAAAEIKDLGYSGVLISPPGFSEGEQWYDRYQPLDYRIIQSPLGDLKSLKQMIGVLKETGLSLFVDIVFNHMAYRPDENLDYPGESLLARYHSESSFKENKIFGNLDENLFSKQEFNQEGCIDPSAYDDPLKIEAVRNGRICDVRAASGLPDLNYQMPRVVAAQREYLTALKQLGADGFRIDAAKHMPIEHIQQVFTPEIIGDSYVFGEIIPAAHGGFMQEFLNDSHFAAYDFTLFYSIHAALKSDGSFESLEDPNDLDTFRSLTFAVTHDIPNNEAMRCFIFDVADAARTDEQLAYAYILGRDGGVPLVYTDHGEKDGLYTDLWKDAFRRPALTAMISFHNAVFGKKMEILSAGKCHLILNREGQGIVVLNKGAEAVPVDVTAQNIQGSFHNVLGPETLTVSSDQHTFDIPPRSCLMYLRD
jgi:alpha-amylase